MWYSLKRKGIKGIKQDVQHCITTAQYLRDELKRHGITAQLNDLSCTVVLVRLFFRRRITQHQHKIHEKQQTTGTPERGVTCEAMATRM